MDSLTLSVQEMCTFIYITVLIQNFWVDTPFTRGSCFPILLSLIIQITLSNGALHCGTFVNRVWSESFDSYQLSL